MELKYFDIGIHFEFMLTFYILAVRCGGRWLYILTFYWAITNRNEARYLEILSPDHARGCRGLVTIHRILKSSMEERNKYIS